jgi:ubiquinone/menaquinone biosynthesis C-methylase UbiE
MRLSEQLLFWLAKRLYRTEIAHSEEMKDALKDTAKHEAYRAAQIQRVIAAADQYGVGFRGKDVLDLGCGDGALSAQFLTHGAGKLIGVDIDAECVERAREINAGQPAEFCVCSSTTLPLPDECVDTVVSFDVFEHVARPRTVLAECLRVLRPSGKMLIGTWGWQHPFAPHLWATMPVPWAHVFFSERTILRTCRRVFQAPWYVPNQSDLDENGRKLQEKYDHVSISSDYLNKFLLSDFEQAFREAGFKIAIHLLPFSSRWARWTKPLLHVPFVREFVHAYFWAVLTKPAVATACTPPHCCDT